MQNSVKSVSGGKTKSQVERLAKSTIKITITIPWEMVKKASAETLRKIAKTIKLPGFRQGKAPDKIVEKKLGRQVIYQEMLQELLSEAYRQAIQEHQLKPIVSPQIKPLQTEENKDWQFEALTCEKPIVSLGNYQERIKQELKAGKIWVPGQDEENQPKAGQPLAEKDKQRLAQERLAKIFQVLTQTAKLELPSLLIENEVNQDLAQLLDEIKKLGLTLASYLASVKKNASQLRQEQTAAAINRLRLELILNEVADDLKVTVSDQDLETLIQKSAQTEAEKKSLTAQKYYLASALRRQKTIDKLMNL